MDLAVAYDVQAAFRVVVEVDAVAARGGADGGDEALDRARESRKLRSTLPGRTS